MQTKLPFDHLLPSLAARYPEIAELLARDLTVLLNPAPPPAPSKERSEKFKHLEQLAAYAATLAVALQSYPHKALCAQQAAELIGIPYDSISAKGWSSVLKQAGLARTGYNINTRYAPSCPIYGRRIDLVELSVDDWVARRNFLSPGSYVGKEAAQPA